MGATALVAAVIGTSVYSANEQRKAQSKAQDAQRQAELEARRIAAEKKPLEETATLKTNAQSSPLGTLGLIVPPDTSARPTKSTLSTVPSGLGFGG